MEPHMKTGGLEGKLVVGSGLRPAARFSTQTRQPVSHSKAYFPHNKMPLYFSLYP